MVGCYVCHGFTQYQALLVLRGVMGISEALYIPAGLSLIADYHSGKTRSLAIGIHMTGLYTGSALGGFGASVAAEYGWHSAFHWFGITGMIYAIVLIVFLREKKDPHPTIASPSNRLPLFEIRLLFSIWLSGLFSFISQHQFARMGYNWFPVFADSLSMPMEVAGGALYIYTCRLVFYRRCFIGGRCPTDGLQRTGGVYSPSAISLGLTIPS